MSSLKPQKFNKIYLLIGAILLLIGCGGGFLLGTYFTSNTLTTDSLPRQMRQTSLSASRYKFIDPLLSCSLPEQKAGTVFAPLKNKIDAVIKDKIASGKAAQISVYFDTRDGRWLGINASKKYFPGSLMKVPTLITALKVAESDPQFLNKKIIFPLGSTDYNTAQYFKPFKTLTPGSAYTIDDLLLRTVAYSDNNAVQLIINAINTETLQEIYTDLGIHLPSSPDQINDDFMTVKDYARFFKFLYNASYLNRDMSEKALSLLSLTDFQNGILAGTPPNTVVAQKFGEHFIPDPTGQTNPLHELHDCGIVYHPLHPYLLCIMTKGTDYANLTTSIKDISSEVYNFVDTQYPTANP